MNASVGFAKISTHVLIKQILSDIKEQYLDDDTPWVVSIKYG